MLHHRRPGPSQSTNIRIKALILDALASGSRVEMIFISPEPTIWNKLPVSVVCGLEAGLIDLIHPKLESDDEQEESMSSLIKRARHAAKVLGHNLLPFKKYSVRASARCVNCGARVSVNLIVIPNEEPIQGDAIHTTCTRLKANADTGE